MSANTNDVKALAKQLAATQLKVRAQWMTFALPASRLAALGDTRQLQRFFQAVKPHQASLLRLLRERALEGIDHLENKTGLDAAKAAIDAQDAACFLDFGKAIIFGDDTQIAALWDEWIELSGAADLDEAGIEHIQDWLKQFPIPLKARIRVITAPISAFQMRAIATLVSPRERIGISWKARSNLAKKLPMAAKDGSPCQAILNRVREANLPCQVKGRTLLISRWLKEDDWTLCVRVNWKQSYCAAEVERVRIDCRPAQHDPNDPDVFFFRLAPLSYDVRLRILFELPLHITLASGEWITVL